MRDPKFPDWNHVLVLALIFIGGSILGGIPLIIDLVANGIDLENLEDGLDLSGAMSH